MIQKLLKYNHPAASGYDVRKIYTLDELQEVMNIDEIKTFFIPINFKWDEKVKKIIKEV
jgi:hypothetical protein